MHCPTSPVSLELQQGRLRRGCKRCYEVHCQMPCLFLTLAEPLSCSGGIRSSSCVTWISTTPCNFWDSDSSSLLWFVTPGSLLLPALFVHAESRHISPRVVCLTRCQSHTSLWIWLFFVRFSSLL